MKKSVTLILFLLSLKSFGQFENSPTSRFYEYNSNIRARDIIEHSNGNRVLCGNGVFLFGQQQYYGSHVLCLDTSGMMVWEKTYTTFTGSMGFNRMVELANGNVVCVGYLDNPMSNLKGGAMLCIDSMGIEVWKKSFENGNNVQTQFTDIVNVSDSTFLAVGYQSVEQGCGFVGLFSIEGELLWSKSYRDLALGSRVVFKSIDYYSDGSMLISGSQIIGNNDNKGIIVELDSIGNIEQCSITEESNSFFSDAKKDSTGLYIRNVGLTNGIFKFNDSLELIWNKYANESEFGFFEPLEFLNRDLIFMDSSDIIFYNNSFGSNTFHRLSSNGVEVDVIGGMGAAEGLEIGQNGLHFLISGPAFGVKGNELYNEHFAITSTSHWENLQSNCLWYGSFLNLQSDGVMEFENYNLFSCDSFLLNNAMMEEVTFELISDAQCIEFLGAVDEINEKDIKIFPNPSTDFICIQLENIVDLIEVVNLNGQSIQKINVNDFKIILSMEGLEPGTYFLRVGANTKKFVKIE